MHAVSVVLLLCLPGCAARVSTASSPSLSRVDATLTRQVDGLLDRLMGKGGVLDAGLAFAEEGISNLRSRVREDRLPMRRVSSGSSVALDAAVAGCTAGFLCGKIVVGDPLVMAVAGAVGLAAATRWPEPDVLARGYRRTAGTAAVGCAYEGSRIVARLRGSVVRRLQAQR